MRIVSLLPSATEIVAALGAAGDLVGVSHECDFPPDAVRGRVVLTRSRLPPGGSSAAIDRAVRAALTDALSLYAVDEAALAALAPDVVVTQDLCEVCAVSLDDVRAAVARLAHRERVDVVSLRPALLADVWADVERVAGAIGRAAAGRALRATLEARVAEVAARAHAAAAPLPRVVTLEWIDPLMIGGTWMPELVALAGGEPVGAEAGFPAPTVSSARLAALAPDVVVIKPCGFDLARALAERELIERHVLAAVPRARVFVTDGNAYFNRPGPRLVESVEILAACLHPEVFVDLATRHASQLERLA